MLLKILNTGASLPDFGSESRIVRGNRYRRRGKRLLPAQVLQDAKIRLFRAACKRHLPQRRKGIHFWDAL